MAGQFGTTITIDRPIADVFAFLAEGTNDPKFSPRVLEIRKATDGPVGVGTVFASTVKDAGMKTKREIKITEFVEPSKIRWTEVSKNLVTSAEGGYDLEADGTGTKLTFFNSLEGHGLGKLFASPALKSAQKGADKFGQAIKAAVEAA
jgi:carbon monoxide dehydrogenase subunit G